MYQYIYMAQQLILSNNIYFRGKLSDIDPETMEHYDPEETTRKTCNLELWDSLPGPLEDPRSRDLEFQDRATSCVAKALDNLYYERSTNVRGEEVKSWLFKEDPNGRLTVCMLQ